MVAAPPSFFVGRIWVRFSLGAWLLRSCDLVLAHSYLLWLVILFFSLALLRRRLYHARDVELLLTLPQAETRVFWRKWASIFPTPLHLPSQVFLTVALWCFLLGAGATWTAYLTLPLLVWSNLLVLAVIAAALAALHAGRSLAAVIATIALGTWILMQSQKMPAEAAFGGRIDWIEVRAAFASGPWSLLMPPRWALGALAAQRHAALATGVAAGLALGVTLLVLAATQARLRSAFTWRSLVERREKPSHGTPGRRPARDSRLASYVEGTLSRRIRALLRMTTQTPHPVRRLRALLPLTAIWTLVGAAIRLLESLMPDPRAGDPGAFFAFLALFGLPLVLGFVLSAAVALHGAPTVLPRGDARYPPAQTLPVSFDEHLQVALLSLLLHLAGFAVFLLPFVLLVPFTTWGYVAFLVVGLWVVAFDALGRAAGPRVSPLRRFERMRRIPFLGLGIPVAILVILRYLDVGSESWGPASWIFANRRWVASGAVAALPPVFALRWWYLRRQIVRRRFDVEGIYGASLPGVHDEPSPFHSS